ncbi:hypothetical protein M0638_18830 [Roseomonas sp. NAR14]|uniref:Uncharacterized protein n=1 Tax=Roseomonas acroporae TaxID=2937791 RepID=A0A9X2BXZ3_9PROT|nr:hypothetical protein [Roseomonas acroporae]MCK8786434.1 hypothetical protein [Roseomonas acroporae]
MSYDISNGNGIIFATSDANRSLDTGVAGSTSLLARFMAPAANPMGADPMSKVSGGDAKETFQSGYGSGDAYEGYQQFYGGGGNDTFKLRFKDFGSSADNGMGTSKYVADFHGAGGYSVPGENDFIVFVGFSAGTHLSEARDVTSAGNAAQAGYGRLLQYTFLDAEGHALHAADGSALKLNVHSMDGAGLAAGDYLFT